MIQVHSISTITSIRGTFQCCIDATVIDALVVVVAGTNEEIPKWFRGTANLKFHAPPMVDVQAPGTHLAIGRCDGEPVPGIVEIHIQTLLMVTSTHHAFHHILLGDALLVVAAWTNVHTLGISALRAQMDKVPIGLALQRAHGVKTFVCKEHDHSVAPVIE